MKDIKITFYQPQYAASVADMWNRSGENWGGESIVHTAESIINEEERSGNICTFLALDGEEVVGYCSFSNYKQDEGASYIPSLNVRPDYIGQKVGKKLVLSCVERAIKSEWPRLDLYTWPGNDKAVPLYKKCGFFWERHDQDTHLMNFLPYVMKTEAVKELFDTIDWYGDSQREIKIESDGRPEGDFEFYDYQWRKNDLMLNMEFERRGRGLTCIETNEYLIRVRLKKQDLIFGRNHQIEYELVKKNKNAQPLEVSIKGIDNKNIKYEFEYRNIVKDQQRVTAEFYLDTIDNKQEKTKTHPCVTSLITINGKQALFKIGVNPLAPVKIELVTDSRAQKLGMPSTCYLNLENNFTEDIEVEYTLNSDKYVSFTSPTLITSLKAKQKKSVKVPCVINKYGFYQKDTVLKITTENTQTQHTAVLRTAFRGYYGKYHGETEDGYNIYCGAYQVELSKTENRTIISKLGIGIYPHNSLIAGVPQLGKPYYSEFKTKSPDKVEFISKEHSEVIKAVFASDKFPEIVLNYYAELFPNGIVNLHSEVENTSRNNSPELALSQECMLFLENAKLPYDGGVVESNNSAGLLAKKWDINKITENWLFSSHHVNAGLGWDPSSEVLFQYVSAVIESNLGSLQPAQRLKTKPIVYTLDTFASWQQFREYMGNYKAIDSQDIMQGFTSSINNNNPFIADTVKVTCAELKHLPVAGSLELSAVNNTLPAVAADLQFEQNKAELKCSVLKQAELDIVTMDFNINSQAFTRKKAIFFKSSQKVMTSQYTEQNKKIFEVSNGLITLKAAPEFSSGIFSLVYQGTEWLNHSFPTPCIKGWWNHWPGGITLLPRRMSFVSVPKQQKTAEFVEITDNHGNEWTGIKTVIDIVDHEKHQGIKVEEYYLLVSGAPVVGNFAIIHQNTGEYKYLELRQWSFIQAGEQVENWISYTENGTETKYRCGGSEYEVSLENCLVHGAKGLNHNLTRLLDKDLWHEFNNSNLISFDLDMAEVEAADGETVKLAPQYMIFSKEKLDKNMIKDLRTISFDL